MPKNAIYNTLNNDQLIRALHRSDTVLVDTRDSNLFNGWPEPGRTVGGHIPSARNITVSWLNGSLTYLDSLLATKGITPDKFLILYGSDAQSVADWLLSNKPFNKTSMALYPLGIQGWLNQGQVLDTLPDFQRLVPPWWLASCMASSQAPVIIDVSWGSGTRFMTSHIPGAIHVNTDWVESGPLWNLRHPEALMQTLASLGIRVDTPVVVYGDDMMAAARVVFSLDYVGIRDVRLLNGGWRAWKEAGLPVARGEQSVEPVACFGEGKVSDTSLYRTHQVEQLLVGSEAWLVSVRSWAEYIGETSGYSYIEPKGRIAGSHWGRSGPDPYNMQDYLNPDGTLREAADLLGYWQHFGADLGDTLVFYCGTGWRASLAWFAARLVGIERAAVYDGGWLEWSSDPLRPVLTGAPDAHNTPFYSGETLPYDLCHYR